MSLTDAIYALEEQAAGRAPDATRVLSGALALDALTARGDADRDLMDAAAGLRTLATGGALELDERGRRRAQSLAEHVRAVAARGQK